MDDSNSSNGGSLSGLASRCFGEPRRTWVIPWYLGLHKAAASTGRFGSTRDSASEKVVQKTSTWRGSGQAAVLQTHKTPAPCKATPNRIVPATTHSLTTPVNARLPAVYTQTPQQCRFTFGLEDPEDAAVKQRLVQDQARP